jgi:hypothetical protein
VTLIVVFSAEAQLPELGVKVIVIDPAPAEPGLNVEPTTPGPDQDPFGNAGSVRVVRSKAGSVSQRVVVPRNGVLVDVTTSVVEDGPSHDPPLGV